MKSVVISGATSMIGIALMNQCIKNNTKVLAIIRKNSTKLNRIPKNRLVKVLYCDADEYENADVKDLQDKYDAFFHFAWNADKIARNDVTLQEQNIRNTIGAVRLAKRLGCYRFIGAGSQAEYGRFEGVLGPNTPIHPDIAYGIAKYSAGRLSSLLCKDIGLEHIWVRVLSVYGIYDNPNTMISYAINELIAGREPEFTKCEQKWDYLFSEDAGRAFYLVGEKGKNNKIYCLGSGIARTLSDYVKSINKQLGKAEDFGIGKRDYAPMQVMHLCADISELTADTGFIPDIVFEEGLSRTVEFWKKQKKCD